MRKTRRVFRIRFACLCSLGTKV